MTQEVPSEDNSQVQSNGVDTAAMSDEEFLNTVPNVAATEQVEEPKVQDTTETTEEPQQTAVETATTEQEEETTTTTSTESAVDYKGFYEALTKPFKANGREIQVTNPDDAIVLMQKGTDYVKKMTELKPLKQLNQLMQQHGITQEDLGFLADLKAKKPEAIAKIVKESGIDLYQFDVEQASGYTPKAPELPQINDALQATLDELEASSPTFNQTIQVVGNQWDEASRTKIAEHPQLLRILDAQIANGTFAKIDSVLQYERAIGRLTGVSDLDAYVMIEKQLQATAQPTQQPIAVPSTKPEVVQQQQQQKAEQRKQAATPRQMQTNTTLPQINPATLSDEDFLRQLNAAGFR